VAVNCREFLALLDTEGDSPPPDARAHAASCPACARALERALAVRRELRAMGDEAPPAFLAERVMARVRAERAAPTAPVRARAFLRPAFAAAALVAVVCLGYVLHSVLRRTAAPVQEARSAAARGESLQRAGEAAAPPAAPAAPEPKVALSAAPAAAVPAPAREARKPGGAAAPSAAPYELETDAGTTTAEPEKGLAAVRRDEGRAAPRDETGADAAGMVGGVAASRAIDAAENAAAEPAPPEFGARDQGAAPTLAKLDTAAVPAATATPLRDAAASAPAELVEARLAQSTGEAARPLPLPASAAPPEGARWVVHVSPVGVIVLRDAAGRDIGAAHPATLAALRDAALAPGRYLLSRR
jgi:hypothetical protein